MGLSSWKRDFEGTIMLVLSLRISDINDDEVECYKRLDRPS